MRFLLRIGIFLLIVVGVAAAAYRPVADYWKRRNQPEYEQVEVQRGTIRDTVSATGKIEPKLKVTIGSFVSGPILELPVDFNDDVKKGDLMARIDPAIYQANVQRDEAGLATANAEVERVKLQLQHARNDELRGFALREEDARFVSNAELDRLRFSRMAFDAQLKLAEASVSQAEANLKNSSANLRYTQILAPVDGMVIDKKIEDGQTVASSFQTPQLFVLGVGMRDEMYIFASLVEAEIGRIRRAYNTQQPVSFRVTAYPDEFFTGTIREIRMASTETQTVVTYPVIVSAPNPDLKLLPGMTADLTFQVEEKADVIRIPTAALMFYPPKIDLVRAEDRPLLEGKSWRDNSGDDDNQASAATPTVEEVVQVCCEYRRHVWILDGDKLKAIEVLLGISDNRYAELLSGGLEVGMKVVTGIKAKGRPF